MAVNVIVAAVTLVMGGFAVIWIACPRCRPWFEAPKWQVLAWDQPPRDPEDRASTPDTNSSAAT